YATRSPTASLRNLQYLEQTPTSPEWDTSVPSSASPPLDHSSCSKKPKDSIDSDEYTTDSDEDIEALKVNSTYQAIESSSSH
ncbi:hypothetical protein BGX20_007553, partial [Mortierella sp. AD010]